MTDAQRCLPMALSLRGVRHALLLLLTALLMVQTVGVLHRVVHAQQSADMFAHAAQGGITGDAAVLAAIWGGHSNSADCQLFDQACPDLLHVPVVVLPVVSVVAMWMAAFLQERFALFERFYAARGPPAALH